jgi:hypothetical protein
MTFQARVSSFTGRVIFFHNCIRELSGSKVRTHTQSSHSHTLSHIPSNTLIIARTL